MPPQGFQEVHQDSPYGRPGSAAGGRHIVTALSYDLADSTELLQSVGIEEYRDVVSAFQRLAGAAIRAQLGELITDTGDGGMAIFPGTIDARDASSLAIRSGFAIIDASNRVAREQGLRELNVRVGIATSITLFQDGNGPGKPASVTGVALAMATRLQSIAAPGTILVSQDTREIALRSYAFHDLGPQRLKGFEQPQHVWKVDRNTHQVNRFSAFGRFAGPLIGRAEDITVLSDSWKKATSKSGRVLVIQGEAGIGKSRLMYRSRFITQKAGGRLLLFQCMPGSEQMPLHPLLNQFRSGSDGTGAGDLDGDTQTAFQKLGIDDAEVVATFKYLLGVGQDDLQPEIDNWELSRERIDRVVDRAARQLCETGPVMIVVEDIHWIDSTTRILLSQLSRIISSYPLMLALTTRESALLDWLEPTNVEYRRLKPFDLVESRRAVETQLEEGANPEIVDLIVRVSGGSPLFVEEICQWVRSNADYATSRESTADRRSSPIPSTFERVVEARLAGLGQAADIARLAAVVDARFDHQLLSRLAPTVSWESLSGAIAELEHTGILSRFRVGGVPLYGFRHAMIQEAVYNTLLSKQRREIHQTVSLVLDADPDLAHWIETPVRASHAERAGLTQRAIALYSQAAKVSAGRSALTAARELLQRALRLTEKIAEPESRDVSRLEVMSALGPILTSTDGPSSEVAQGLYDEGVAIARRRPSEERARWFPIYWGWWFTGTEVNGARAHHLLAEMQDVDDPEVQLQARHCVWAIDFYLGRHQSCLTSVESGLPLYGVKEFSLHSVHFGGHDTKVCGLVHRGLSLWFKGRIKEAVNSLREARAWAEEGKHVTTIAHAVSNSAMFHCYRRDTVALMIDLEEMRQHALATNLPSFVAIADIFEGWCIGIAGEPSRGQALISKGLMAHQQLQTPEDYPVYCGLLAELLVAQKLDQEALDVLQSAVAEAEKAGHCYWIGQLHRYRARLLMRTGATNSEVLAAFEAGVRVAISQGALAILAGLRGAARGTPFEAEVHAACDRDYVLLLEQADEEVSFYAEPEPHWMNGPQADD